MARPVEQLSVSGFHGVPPVRFALFRILFYNGLQPPDRSSDLEICSSEFVVKEEAPGQFELILR